MYSESKSFVLPFLALSFSLSRNPGEDTKMLVCDMCDKGYHTFCLQPAIDSLPTNGWRCKVGKTMYNAITNIVVGVKSKNRFENDTQIVSTR